MFGEFKLCCTNNSLLYDLVAQINSAIVPENMKSAQNAFD